MSDTQPYPYGTRLNILYGPLEIVEEKKLADECKFAWYNQTLCQVNGSVVRMGVFTGEYHWHKHDEDDEFFYVLEGQLLIDLEGRRDAGAEAGLRGSERCPAPHPRPAAHSSADGRKRRHHSHRQLKTGNHLRFNTGDLANSAGAPGFPLQCSPYCRYCCKERARVPCDSTLHFLPAVRYVPIGSRQLPSVISMDRATMQRIGVLRLRCIELLADRVDIRIEVPVLGDKGDELALVSNFLKKERVGRQIPPRVNIRVGDGLKQLMRKSAVCGIDQLSVRRPWPHLAARHVLKRLDGIKHVADVGEIHATVIGAEEKAVRIVRRIADGEGGIEALILARRKENVKDVAIARLPREGGYGMDHGQHVVVREWGAGRRVTQFCPIAASIHARWRRDRCIGPPDGSDGCPKDPSGIFPDFPSIVESDICRSGGDKWRETPPHPPQGRPDYPGRRESASLEFDSPGNYWIWPQRKRHAALEVPLRARPLLVACWWVGHGELRFWLELPLICQRH